MRGYAQASLESVALWHERDISHSSVERVVLPDATPESPELRNAELLIADPEAIKALGEAGPKRRLLLSPRGSMVDMSMINSFADVLAVPGAPDEVLARIQHVLES